MSKKHHRPGAGSTGPKTEAGREISSANALKHGACSEKPRFLDCEDPEHYERLRKAWYAEYKPVNELEGSLVEDICRLRWRFMRNEKALENVEIRVLNEAPNICDWTDKHHKDIQLATRYRNSAMRAYQASRVDLENLRKNRVLECVAIESLRKVYHHNAAKGIVTLEKMGVVKTNPLQPHEMPPNGWHTAPFIRDIKPEDD